MSDAGSGSVSMDISPPSSPSEATLLPAAAESPAVEAEPVDTPTKGKSAAKKFAPKAKAAPKKRAAPKASEEDGEDAGEVPKKKAKQNPKPVTPKATPKKRAAPKASKEVIEDGDGDDDEGDIEDDDETPKKKKKSKATPAKERQRKAPEKKIAEARSIARSYEECSAEDKMLLDWKEAGKPWGEIRAEWERLTGENTGASTLPNRLTRLKTNITVLKEEDMQLLLQAKLEVESAMEKEKWNLIAAAMGKLGATETYKGDVLQKQYKKMMVDNNMGPPHGVKSADFAGDDDEE